jgi:hypothetical protein
MFGFTFADGLCVPGAFLFAANGRMVTKQSV